MWEDKKNIFFLYGMIVLWYFRYDMIVIVELKYDISIKIPLSKLKV